MTSKKKQWTLKRKRQSRRRNRKVRKGVSYVGKRSGLLKGSNANASTCFVESIDSLISTPAISIGKQSKSKFWTQK
jgi:hypothetical protein